ncbi:MAG: hypothetical protein LUD52_06855 [Opitutae bacterium]|nr:hypothetical protein [Opitutae bacterium]
MKNFCLKTIFAAAALALASFGSARADGFASASGAGTFDSPYSGALTNISFSGFSSSDTVYISGVSGFLENEHGNYLCNIDIGSGGFTINNGFSNNDAIYTFAGDISGSGNWTASSGTVRYAFVFTGDLSNYSGNLSVGTTNNNYPSYIHFGENTVAATDTDVSGTGAISCAATVKYDYFGYAADAAALTVGNTSISAARVEFSGGVNYTVDSDLAGKNASGNALAISNSGTTVLNGVVSGFGDISVASGSTLVLNGEIALTSAIANSGTVVVGSDAVFALDNLSYAGNFVMGATYELIQGGVSLKALRSLPQTFPAHNLAITSI